MLNYKTIHLELSSKCVLKCPRCPRTELNLNTVNQEITLNDFKLGFPVDTLINIDHFIFCGDIGDPIYAQDFLEIIEYVKTNSRSRLRIVTNGSYKKVEWWKKLGLLLDFNDQVTFSVDGWDNTSNNLYRVNSNFNSIINGIKTLRKNSDCSIQWSTIYFSFNQNNINKIRDLAIDLGCNEFKTVKSSKFDGRYSIQGIDILKPDLTLVSPSLVYTTTVENIKSSRYKPIVLESPTCSHLWAKCINFKKDLFVGVDLLVSPCPWFNNGYHQNEFVKQYRKELSIKNRPFLEIINDSTLWGRLLNSFSTDPLEICKLKCKNDQ